MSKKFFGLVLAVAVCTSTLQSQQTTQSPAPAPAQAAPQTAQSPATQAPAAGAQQDQDAGPTLRIGVNEVNLIFTVTDKHGHYIPNLKQSDFALLDDQKAPLSASRSTCPCA